MVLMVKSWKIFLIILGLTHLVYGNSYGQSKRFHYADRQFELANFRLAATEYSKIYSLKQNYLAAKKAAQALDAIQAYGESYVWWKKTVNFEEATKEDVAALINAGYRSVKNYSPIEDLSGTFYEFENLNEFSRRMDSASIFRVYELKEMDEFNSNSSDYSLSKSKSGVHYFSSNRGNGGQIKKAGLRFDAKGNKLNRTYSKSDGKNYYSIYAKSAGKEEVKVKVEGYDFFHLSDPQHLSSGKIIFTATPNKQNKRDQVIYPGVFYGNYDAETHKVMDVVPFKYNQTDAFAVISPWVDEEQGRIYFSSNRPGGLGGYDLYYVTWDEEMNFSEPINLGPSINSSANERDGFRYGNEFYFASDRKGGLGGLDVYMASIQGYDMSPVINLGSQINSVSDDFGFVKYGLEEAFLSSDRLGGKGLDDLYRITWSERNLKILVVDLGGNSLKEGTNLQMIDEEKVISVTDLPELELLKKTKKGKTYLFEATRPGYFNQRVSATLVNDQEEITILMVQVPYDLEVYHETIYYDLDKDFLRELSKHRLDEIISLMARHPELHLVIESHTDSRASDTYNQRLSERRAKSVTKYLEEKGISGQRVSSAWFSKSRLVNDCGDGIPCPDSKHQQNRRSELKLIAFPDKNKVYDLPNGATYIDFKSRESAKRWYSNQEIK
jgi:outer membrane protein OmpA-like peptidoglycan-associated protein